MRTLTFSSNGAMIEVREPIGKDVFVSPIIHSILLEHVRKNCNITGDDIPTTLWWAIIWYERIVSRTVKIEGHIPFTLPSPYASSEEIIAGYEAVMTAPAELIDDWKNNLNNVSRSPVTAQLEGKSPPES